MVRKPSAMPTGLGMMANAALVAQRRGRLHCYVVNGIQQYVKDVITAIASLSPKEGSTKSSGQISLSCFSFSNCEQTNHTQSVIRRSLISGKLILEQ